MGEECLFHGAKEREDTCGHVESDMATLKWGPPLDVRGRVVAFVDSWAALGDGGTTRK